MHNWHYDVLLAASLARQPLADALIKETYRAHAPTFEAALANSELANHPFTALFPVAQTIQMQKVSGIIADARQTGVYTRLERLIRKAYGGLVRYIIQTNDLVPENLLAMALKGKTVVDVDDETFDDAVTVVSYYLNKNQTIERITDVSDYDYTDTLDERYDRYASQLRILEKAGKSSAAYPEKVAEFMSGFRVAACGYRVQSILEEVIHTEIARLEPERAKTALSQVAYHMLTQEVYAKSTRASAVRLLMHVLKTMNVSDELLNRPLTKEIFEAFFMRFFHLSKNMNVSEEEKFAILIATMVQLSLGGDYQVARHLALTEPADALTHAYDRIAELEAQLEATRPSED